MSHAYTHDVIIVGAGIAGSAMALALAKQGLRVALLDKNKPATPTEKTGLRVSSIHLGSEQFLNQLGADLNQYRRGIFKDIEIFQEESLSTLSFSADLIEVPHLGSIIENDILIEAIQSQLRRYDNVTCFWQMTLLRAMWDKNQVTIAASSHTFTAPLVIGADGAHSWLRAQYGLAHDEKPYAQHALVAHVLTELAHQNKAYQRFLNSGPLAFLPLESAHTSSIVWSSDPAHIEALIHMNEIEFAEHLTQAFANRLGQVELISTRAHFPLVMRHAKRYIADRSAFIGDAIHTIHPLAGQGANLGLMESAYLAEAIDTARSHGRDIGDPMTLRRFERERRGANVLMLQAMRFLAQNQKPMAKLRAFMLKTVDNAPVLQQLMMRYAIGLLHDDR